MTILQPLSLAYLKLLQNTFIQHIPVFTAVRISTPSPATGPPRDATRRFSSLTRRVSLVDELPLPPHSDLVNGVRTLAASNYASGTAMTTAACISYCDSKGYIYAGTEYSVECYCDNDLHAGTAAAAADCNMPCSGDPSELCGAGGRINLYWSGKAPPAPPATVPEIGKWKSLGCYTYVPSSILRCSLTLLIRRDNIAGKGRTLTQGIAVQGDNTQAKCGGVPAPASECYMACAGNPQEFCGGPNRLNIYSYTGIDLPPIQGPPGGGGGGGGGGPPAGGAPVFPVNEGLPGTWTYGNCWV
ncbi:hypothetical protein DXG03_009565 [Asterophora parasitica]|uniref:WSC domain-containing protein n=1 Tax=Asterophora parasitica TaxID=117018 RepID=A0A9P7G6J7_9AGAR|nr:hypothetical protein DXG03_009565 [Asterophora parasitica]